MSIEKKSLISTLKTTKKANVASTPVAPEATHVVSKRLSKRVSKRLSKRLSKRISKRLSKKEVL
jgi:hypothetical protein